MIDTYLPIMELQPSLKPQNVDMQDKKETEPNMSFVIKFDAFATFP
jgi:hypothetical protein